MLRFLGYLLVLLAIVPLWGLLASGTWKGAWRYTREWSTVIAGTIAAGVVIGLMLQ